MAGRRVLVTGAGSPLGGALARRLERDPGVGLVAALDPPRPGVARERARPVDPDLRGAALARLIRSSRFDTVVHLGLAGRPEPAPPAGGPEPAPPGRGTHDLLVSGTLELLAACERAGSVRSVVVRGSAGIYGAEPDAPQFLREEMVPRQLRTLHQRDAAELEGLFDTFARRRPELVCTLLRLQPLIGPTVQSELARYLSLPLVPSPLGFDPRLQLVHEHDAVEALVAAVARPIGGAVNVAGEGTVGLTRLLRIAGRPMLPLPSRLFGAAARRAGLHELSPDLRRLLRYGRALDLTRLVDELGYRPRYSTLGAVRDYVASRAGRRAEQPLEVAAS